MENLELEEGLAEFTRAVVEEATRGPSPDGCLELLTRVGGKHLGAYKTGFWRYLLSENSVECTHVWGPQEQGVKRGERLPLDGDIANYVLQGLSQSILMLPARAFRERFPRARLLERQAKTLYVAPLFLRSELLGAFIFECDREAVPKETLDVFRRYVDAIALAYGGTRRDRGSTKRLLHMKLLHQMTEKALMTLDLSELLESTVSLLKNYFLYYNVYIFLYDPEQDVLSLEAMAGEYKDRIQLPMSLRSSQGCVGVAYRSRDIYYCRDTRTDPAYVPEFEELREALSEIAVPITQGDNVLGVLDVQAAEPESFDQFDLESMGTLANELASAITRARDYEILKNFSEQLRTYQEQVDQDLRISEQILNMNVPVDFVSPQIDTALHFRAHHSIGGDIVLLRGAGEYSYVLLGDVSGHGISSALISTSSFSFLSNLLAGAPTVEQLVQLFNDFWRANFKELGYYATFFIGRLHNTSGTFEYVNCAHPRCILYQLGSGSVTELNHGIPPIGLFELDAKAAVQQQWLKLAAGDKLVLYTDGFLCDYPHPGRFTDDDVRNLIARFGSLPHAIFHQFILWHARHKRRGVSSADDEVLLSLCYNAHPAVGHYHDNIDQTLSLIRKVGRLGMALGVPGESLDQLNTILEETALALLARRKQAPVVPRLFVSVDFQPRKLNLALLDANLFLKEENFADFPQAIPPLEKQLPEGSLKLIKSRSPQVEIKRIEKGLLFSCPFERRAPGAL